MSSEDEMKMVGGDLPSDLLSHSHLATFDDVYVILSDSDCSFYIYTDQRVTG